MRQQNEPPKGGFLFLSSMSYRIFCASMSLYAFVDRLLHLKQKLHLTKDCVVKCVCAYKYKSIFYIYIYKYIFIPARVYAFVDKWFWL
jgi:hypothetical protein